MLAVNANTRAAALLTVLLPLIMNAEGGAAAFLAPILNPTV